MRNAVALLAALLIAETACGDPIPWNAAHVKAMEDNGIVDRSELRKEKKQKKSKSVKEKKHKKKSSKSAKSHKGALHLKDTDNDSSSNNGNNNNYSNGSSGNECSGDVVAIAPKTFCVEWIPGIGFSKECDTDETEDRGGEVCNLVSKAWLRALTKEGHDVDLVLNHAGMCQADIKEGAVTQAHVDEFLPKGYDVVIVEMTGQDVIAALQQGANAAYNGNPKTYPYGSAIRYKVDMKRSKDEGRVYDIEVKPGFIGGSGDWQAIDRNTVYKVATNSKLANGGAGYGIFGSILDDKKTTLEYTDAELFVKYANQKCNLEGAPYSTLKFEGLGVLIDGEYKCLEDESLCDCGYC